MTAPRVAVCIPTFNQADYLAICLESALKQTYPEIEILVADDASSDHTPQVLAEFAKRDPRIRYHRQETNQGIAKNTNWLINNTQAPYIIRFDSDNVMKPTFLEQMVQALEQQPQAAYAHCAVEDIDEKGNLIRIHRLGRKSGFQNADEAFKASLYGMRLSCFVTLFRATALKAVGFRGQLLFAEDWDVTIRLACAGWGNVYLSEILAEYRIWEDTAGTRSRRQWKELTDLVMIYDDFERTFQEKGLNVAEVKRVRQERAVNYAIALGQTHLTAEEKQKIASILKALGDCPALRRRIRLIEKGFGPLFEFKTRCFSFASDFIKSLFFK